MPLSDLANIAQVIASAAVVGSLVFIGLQLMQTKTVNRAAALQANANYSGTTLMSLMDQETAKLYAKAAQGDADLDPGEFAQYFSMCRTIVLGVENMYFQDRAGLLDHGAYLGYATMAGWLFSRPGARAMWNLSKQFYSPDFVAQWDQLLAKMPLNFDPRSQYKQWKQLTVAMHAGKSA